MTGALASLLEALADPARFSKLVEQLQEAAGPDTTKVGVRVAAALAVDANRDRRREGRSQADVEQALQTMADSCARLTPDMMLAMLVAGRRANQPSDSRIWPTTCASG